MHLIVQFWNYLEKHCYALSKLDVERKSKTQIGSKEQHDSQDMWDGFFTLLYKCWKLTQQSWKCSISCGFEGKPRAKSQPCNSQMWSKHCFLFSFHDFSLCSDRCPTYPRCINPADRMKWISKPCQNHEWCHGKNPERKNMQTKNTSTSADICRLAPSRSHLRGLGNNCHMPPPAQQRVFLARRKVDCTGRS